MKWKTKLENKEILIKYQDLAEMNDYFRRSIELSFQIAPYQWEMLRAMIMPGTVSIGFEGEHEVEELPEQRNVHRS